MFNIDKFKTIITQLKRNLFSNGDLKKVGNLLFYGMLNPNSKERFTPRKTLVILKKIEETFENELKIDTNITSID